MNEVITSFIASWQRVVTPHRTVIDTVQRQAASMLAGLTLALLLFNSVGGTVYFLATRSITPQPVIAEIIFLVAYLLSRSPSPRWGSVLLIVSMSVAIFVIFPASNSPHVGLVGIQAPNLLAAILLPVYVAAAIGIANIGGATLLLAVTTPEILGEAGLPLLVVVFTSLVVLWAANVRNQDLRTLGAQARDLNDSQERYQSLFDDVPIGLYQSTVTGEFVEVNAALVKLLGYPNHKTLMATSTVDLYRVLEQRSAWQSSIGASELDHIFEVQLKCYDGGSIWSRINTRVLRGEDDQVVAYRGSIEDITEIRRAQDQLVVERALLRSLIDSIPDLIFYKDVNGVYLGCNKAWQSFIGRSETEIVGATDYDLADAYDAQSYVELDRKVVERQEPLRVELWGTNSTGERVLLDTLRTPFIGSEGQMLGVIGISRDVTKRHRMAEQLAQARDEALEGTRLKSEFLASMSHELRTPLNGIFGMTSLLLDTALSPEQHNYAVTVRSSADALLSLINDVLDFSKIGGGKMALERQPFEVGTCVEEAIDILAPKAGTKGLELAFFVDPQTPTAVVGDVTRLRQVLVSLIDNAVKFTDHGEVVVTANGDLLEASQDAQEVYQLTFAVRDTGIGIPEDHVEQIFRAFTQVDASTTRKYGGVGLGLAICQQLIELMDGHIWVESEPGQGSTFYFTIKAAATSSRPAGAQKAAQQAIAGKRVLIVDDNETNRFILDKQTESWGLVPVTAASGPDALELLSRDHQFDMAILDMQMPDMDGLTLAREIRKRPFTQTLPLILLSSLGGNEVETNETSFVAHLTKPVKPSRLFNVISDILTSIVAPEPVPQEKPQFDPEMAKRHPLRILIAEDNAVNQKLAVLMLSRLGYRADVAANGLEAVEAAQRQPYNVILMDVEMPEMDGPEATQHIREITTLEKQPYIVAATAHAMAGDRERLLQAGMDDYISKPIRLDDLISTLLRCPPDLSEERTQDVE